MRRSFYGLAGAALAALVTLLACGSDEAASSPPAIEDDASDANVALLGDAADARVDAAEADAAKSTCSHEGWCGTVTPTHQNLRAVWGDGTDAVWAVGSCGTPPAERPDLYPDACINRYDGTSWATTFTVPASDFRAIWGRSATDVWVGGSAGLYHGQGATSASLTWTKVDLASAVTITSLWGSAVNDVWLAGFDAAHARIMHFTGAWALDPLSSQLASATPLNVFGSGAGDVWLTGTAGYAQPRFFHRDGTSTWTDVTPPLYLDSFTFFATAGYASATGSVFLSPFVSFGDGYRSFPVRAALVVPDAGAPPLQVTEYRSVGDTAADGVYATINGMWGTSATDVWMVAQYGRVRHWDGATWKLAFITPEGETQPLLTNLSAVWGSGLDDIWVVGFDLAIHKKGAM